jgi:hypothetical protein
MTKQALGKITSMMQWTFYHTPNYTKVLTLLVNHAPVGGSVIVSCRGGGCPFTTYVAPVRGVVRTPPSINLMPSFRGLELSVGDSLVVELVRPDWIGKHYLFTVRAGQPPGIQIRCLAPGGNRPGVGC